MGFLNKYQVETVSQCNRKVKSVPTGQVEISSRQNWIM